MTRQDYNLQAMNRWQRVLFRLRTESLFLFMCRLVRSFILECEELKKRLWASFYKLTRRDRFIVRDVLGSKMYLDLDDQGLSRDLLVYGIREPMCTEVMQQELKPGQVVVEVGANIGYYALLESRLVGAKGRVYCLEPAPENVTLLRRNIAGNGYKNVEVFQAAAGAASGNATLYLSTSHNQHMLATEKVRDAVGSIAVPVVALDDFLKDKPYPSLVRMDIEGLELDVLRGMKKTLAVKKPLKFFVEVHCFFLKAKVRDLFRILRENSFRIKVGVWEKTNLSGGAPVRKVFDYCSNKLGVGEVGPFWPTMDELEKRLAAEEELSVTVFFERS